MEQLVDTSWLAARLDAADLVILDASAHLPNAGRDAKAEFAAAHIKHARFLDLGSWKDAGSPVPAALPNPAQVASRMAMLGISPDQRIVLYDDSNLKSSARAWFILRRAGYDRVTVLDGGLAKWKVDGGAMEAGKVSHARIAEKPVPSSGELAVRTKAEMLQNCETQAAQVVDARDTGRFAGVTADTVHDLPGGHIPGARNVPFAHVLNDDGTYKRGEALRAAFTSAGIDLDRPVITSCGSGMTASVLLFALHLLGKTDVALYDGSWMEWGSDPDTPKETGAA
ncbi:Thiosulfate sulfurtransferase [Alteripontixanthobacter maritimus]|uniref:Sulfurtransferase n=1 Tax=Alteripontixanthobacter maritimus TaxID=2161824 RepID=A0A369Q3A8_9SPHN|nr:sulfurtransferase [Alteripontixanthobacter maritimus]RDC59371.1 Thiosulfate sulfurtransferase [Alteripontixanthobacter maritimus]